MIPDLTLISRCGQYPLEIKFISSTKRIYLSYNDLFYIWDRDAKEKIPPPKAPCAPHLNMTDFIALGNALVVYGFIS